MIFGLFFWFLKYVWTCLSNFKFLVSNRVFSASPCKIMQKHQEVSSKTQCGRNWDQKQAKLKWKSEHGGKPFGKTYIVWYIFTKISFLTSRQRFYSFKLFFRFLAEIRFRTIIKVPKKQVLEPKRAVLVPPAPCLKLQSVLLRLQAILMPQLPHRPLNKNQKPRQHKQKARARWPQGQRQYRL